MEKREFIPFEEVLDETYGRKGTPERENYELGIELYLVGQKIREIREAKQLTQEDLGKLIGVQKAQISRIESGKNQTMSTLQKVFKALNVHVKLQVENAVLAVS